MAETTALAAAAADAPSSADLERVQNVHAGAGPARRRDPRGPRTPAPPGGSPSTPRSRRSRRASRSRHRTGAGTTRCCSGSSASSPRSARCSSTAPSSPSIRSTRSPAPSRRSSPRSRSRARTRNGNGTERQRRRGHGGATAPRRGGRGARRGRGAAGLGRGARDDEDEEIVAEAPDDPGASRRFWFEHATGAGKTVAAVGFVEASRTGGILILTHRRNLVDQFIGEISDRGYADRLSPPLLKGKDNAYGPVTVETYQWFVRNAGKISNAYSIVICDEAHTALGEKTSACIRNWQGPVFIGMTATGALIARHVADLFPTQTSRFDLAQAARRGVIAPLRCIRIPPGPGVRTLANVPLRRGEVDQDFDQEQLAELLDQGPFNVAIADLYSSRFKRVPGVIYTAGVKHANNVAAAMREFEINARAVSGETPKRELAEILAGFERGEVDVLCNAMLLAEGWNSPRATICMHLAPTASKRIYQQRVGRVTRRNPGKEAGLVIDLVHPATRHDETIVTLHSLLDRDVYRGGAIVVGPVRRGRGRRVRVEKRVIPVSADPERRMQVLEREMWRIAVERLDYSEQHVWAALAGARVQPNSWRKAKAMLQHDQAKELRRRFLLTCIQRNRSTQLKLKALGRARADARGRPLRRGDRHGRDLAARPAPRRRPRPAAGARREPDRPPRPGPGLGLAPRRVHPRAPTRSTRSPAGPRRSACSASSSTPPAAPTARTPAASSRPPAARTAASPSPCSPPPSPTRRRPRRSCAAPGCGWPASPPPSPASCSATCRRAARSAAAAASAPARRTAERERRARERRREEPRRGGDRGDRRRRGRDAETATRRGRRDRPRRARARSGAGQRERAGRRGRQGRRPRRLAQPQADLAGAERGDLAGRGADEQVAALVDARRRRRCAPPPGRPPSRSPGRAARRAR